MGDNTPTTDDVRDALDHLNTVETSTADGLFEGVRAAVSDEEVGEFMKAMRVNGFERDAKRLGDTVVAHIYAEESEGLGDLFG